MANSSASSGQLVAELARDAHQGRVQAEPGLGADDHQVEPVGQGQLQLLGALVGGVRQIDASGA